MASTDNIIKYNNNKRLNECESDSNCSQYEILGVSL